VGYEEGMAHRVITPAMSLPAHSPLEVKRWVGDCVSVRVAQRGAGDAHVVVEVLLERSDREWETAVRVSSTWLDELIRKLQAAKRYCENHCDPDPCGWGVCFRESANVQDDSR